MKLSPEAKVGAVVIVGLLLLSYMTFTVGGYRFGGGGYRISVLFDSVKALEKNASVRVAGVDVGYVEEIQLVEGQARTLFRIRPAVQIRKGARASIRSTGLLGEKYVAISSGKEEGILKDGDSIDQVEGMADLDTVMGMINSTTEDLKAVITSLSGAIGTPEGKERLKEMVINLTDLTKSFNSALQTNRETLGETAENLQEFSTLLKEDGSKLISSLRGITGEIEKGGGTLGKLVKDRELYDNLNEALVNFNKIARKVDRGEGAIGKLLGDEEFYATLNKALTHFNTIAQQLDSKEGTLGKLLEDRELYDNLNEALVNFNKITHNIEKKQETFLGRFFSRFFFAE